MAGHAHAPHASHGHGEDHHLGPFRLELLIAVLLGLAITLGAVSTYLGHRAGGRSNTDYNEAVRSSTDSNLFYNQGNQRLIQYQSLFLEYAKDAVSHNTALTDYVRSDLMDPTLRKMLDWWTTGSNTNKYASPFVSADPYFAIPEYASGHKADVQTSALFEQGKKQEETSNAYTLVEVLTATALFLYGVASITRGRPMKLGFLAGGFLFFALSVAQLVKAATM
jgi:hypothetical protein